MDCKYSQSILDLSNFIVNILRILLEGATSVLAVSVTHTNHILISVLSIGWQIPFSFSQSLS